MIYVTKQTAPVYDSSGQAGAIEVTPAMIEAGVTAAGSYEPGWDSLGDVVVDVFRAMMGATTRVGDCRETLVSPTSDPIL
jgi:hypothetical protein